MSATKTPKVEICPTDPLKYFSYFKAERPPGDAPHAVHRLDRLFVNDPIRHNVRQTFRLSIPIMQADDRLAACEVVAALLGYYRMTENHRLMLDYAHTVRLYDEMHKYVLRTEKAVYDDEQN